MDAILLSIATFFSTYLGGLLAIKFKNKLNSIMGLAAGVLLGVVALEVLPEIIEQIKISNIPTIAPMIALVVGFLLFHIIEKSVLIHHAHEGEYSEHTHPHVGIISALALIGHSFMDGLSIGLAFQINPTVGLIVAIAIISHDFTDGMNTVTLMLVNKNSTTKAKLFLLLDSLAPILGVAATLFFTMPKYWLVLYLGFFAGFLLYIGATDILPEAHSKKSSYKTIFLTIAGVALIFIITQLIK